LGPERRLIDRHEAVAVIRSEFTSATTGQGGGCQLLIGDSGVGKTRIAEQGMRMADELGMAVLLAQCIDRHAEPLLPFRDALATYRKATPVRDLLRAAGEALLDYAPFLEAFLGIGDAESVATPLGGSGSQGVYEGLAQVLVGLAASAGLCIVVEDLTDADRDTLSFLEYLGRKAATSRVVMIATVKEDLLELDPDLIDRIDKWRAGSWSANPVPPLAREDAAEFIAFLRNGQPVASEWVDEVLALTGGNPYFIEQVVNLAAESQGREAGLTDVPDRIEAVLTRRLRRLADHSRSFLRAAAVALDLTNRLDLVAHVGGIDIDTASDRLGETVRQRFLTEDAQGNIAFAQKLLQRVLYEEIAPRMRTAMNVRAAEWLEGQELFASASHHYDRAGCAADMVRTALRGAQQAERAGTYATAVQLYLRARPTGDFVAIGLLLARDYLILGAWTEANEVLASLPLDLGEARILRSDLYFVRGSFERALRELRLAAQDPTVDRTGALIRLADIHLYLGRLREAIDLASEALEGATDATIRATCLASIGTSLYHLGDIDGAEETYLEELKALPEEADQRDQFAYTVALHNLGLAREARGDWTGAKRFHEEALRWRLDVSAAREVGHSRHSLIRCEIALGSFETARQMLTEARAAAIALGEELEQGKLDHTEARIEVLTGDNPNAAIRLIESALERFRDLNVAYDIANASFSLASAYATAGAPRRALEEAASARAQMERGEFGLLTTLYPDIAYSYGSRVEAGLLGYAAGDAVGLPWEGTPPTEIDPNRLPSLHATDEWPAGSTSDDTALTLLVAEELVATGRADAGRFMARLAAAAPSIHGLGPSTTAAIEGFLRTGELPTADGNTNGSLMRALPIGWALPIDRVEDRRDWVIELSRATHPGPEAITAACIGAACAAWAIEGASAMMLLNIAREEAAIVVAAQAADPRINDMLAAVAAGTWRPDRAADDLDPYETVTRVIWCIVHEPNVTKAMLAAVRLGGDTDTVAALVGGLLGCRMAAENVRQELPWIGDVRMPADDVVERVARGITSIRVAQNDG
jgi:ADP-ribosylglycohydrolase/tetratricopeptide (TPR) repeat protein